MASTIFKASSGLNVNIDPVRLPFDPETGVQDLAVAYNVVHDRTGRISRRKGYSATAVTSVCHSLWSDNELCFYVSGTSLYQLATDYSSSLVATVTADARVSFHRIANRVYWMNGHEKGYIENGENNEWTAGTYYGPDTNRRLSDPPIGSIVTSYNGRVYVARDNVLWYSDPFNLNAFDLSRNFVMFQSPLKMVRPVSTGIYVGTERSVWFLLGSTAREFSLQKKTSDPPVLGTDLEIDLSTVPSELIGIGAIWTGTDGICVGTSDGTVLNLTRKKVDYPLAYEGAAAIVNDRYISILEP